MADIQLDTIEDAVAAVGRGEIIVVVDDEDHENEGALVVAAEHATADTIAFFVRYTSGLICVAMTSERLDQIDLSDLTLQNGAAMPTAFTASIDYRHGTTTGISAADRAVTITKCVDPTAQGSDFARPGHIFPLRYREGGVLTRAGHTEAAVDVARLAGCAPAGVLCELVNDDGTMSRQPELRAFADEHGLKLVSIADLVRYRRRTETLVRRIGEARIPTAWGPFTGIAFESLVDGIEHLAIVRGDPEHASDVVVRVHSECLTGDVFGSMRCDCGAQLDAALERIAEEGVGVLVYLRGHEGRGIGIGHKMRAYSLQDAGRDTVDANTELGLPVDSREYGIGAQMLVDLGIKSMRIMTNNPKKYRGLDGYDIEITGRVVIDSAPNPENIGYLRTKRERMGHLLEGLETDDGGN